MERDAIELGRQYKHSLHKDIKGVATAYIHYLTGCDQVGLECVMDGEIKTHWVDITNLAEVSVPKSRRKPGGPGPTIPQRSRPTGSVKP